MSTPEQVKEETGIMQLVTYGSYEFTPEEQKEYDRQWKLKYEAERKRIQSLSYPSKLIYYLSNMLK